MRARATSDDRRSARGMAAPESAETIVVRGAPTAGANGHRPLACDAYGQTTSALRAVVDALAQHGATTHDIVRARIFVADPSAWTTVGRAYTAFFGSVCPIATMADGDRSADLATVVEVEVHALPGRTALKPACERCGAPLAEDPQAAHCGWNCSFCAACTAALGARCPNCSGVLFSRRRAAPPRSR